MMGASESEWLSPAQIASFLPKINANIEDVKGRVYDVISRHYDELEVSYDFSEGLENEIKKVRHQLRDMKDKLTSAENELRISEEEKNKAVVRLTRSQSITNVLQHLCSIHEKLLLLESSEAGPAALLERAQTVGEISTALAAIAYDPDSQIADRRILKALKSEFIRCKSQFRTELEQSWRKAVTWTAADTHTPGDRQMMKDIHTDDAQQSNPAVAIRLSSGMRSLNPLAHAMMRIDVFQSRLDNFARKLMQHVVMPCVRNADLVPVVGSESPLVTTLRLPTTNEDKELDPLTRPLRVYNKLRTVFQFIEDVVFAESENNEQYGTKIYRDISSTTSSATPTQGTHTDARTELHTYTQAHARDGKHNSTEGIDMDIDTPHRSGEGDNIASANANNDRASTVPDTPTKASSRHVRTTSNVFLCALGKAVWPKLVDLLIDEMLVGAIPKQAPMPGETDEAYQQVIEATRIFETDMVLKGIAQGPEADSRELTRYAENVSVHFSNSIREDLLLHARDVLRDFTETRVISEGDNKPEPSDSTAPTIELSDEVKHLSYALPEMTITVSVERLLALAVSALHQACDEDQNTAVQRFFTARDMFELFRAVVPVLRDEAIRIDPSVAFLVYTDCLYLSHKLSTLAMAFVGKIPLADSCVCTFVDQVVTIREMGDDYYLDTMRKYETQLRQCIQIPGGLGNTDELTSYSIVQKHITSALDCLTKQSIQFSLLPTQVALKSLGYLLDILCDGLSSMVLALADISEEECTKLNTLLSMVTAKAPTLFSSVYEPQSKVHADVDIAQFSSEFARFGQIVELLDMRMKVMVQKYLDGQLNLTANETRSMVKALFQESSIRRSQLARLDNRP